MVDIILPNDGDGYTHMPPYMYFEAPQIIEWGVKIHVSARYESGKILANTCLPPLIEAKVPHKVIKSRSALTQAESNVQARKFITVYPQSAEQFHEIAGELDALILGIAILTGPERYCFDIDGDLPMGESGYVFARFGAFVATSGADDRDNVSDRLFAFLKDGEDCFEASPQLQGRHARRSK